MKLGMVAMLLAMFLMGVPRARAAAPPPPMRPRRAPGGGPTSLPASELRAQSPSEAAVAPLAELPGVPAELVIDAVEVIDSPSLALDTPEAHEAIHARQGLRPRLSVQPAELPSTPLAAGMTVSQRARARDLARAAARAVRGQGPAIRAGVQPVPDASVASFQLYVGLDPHGRWTAETVRYAAALSGLAMPERLF